MEGARDRVGANGDFEHAHPPAALSADGDINPKHAGEKLGPTDATRPGRSLRHVVRLHAREARAGEPKRELLLGAGVSGIGTMRARRWW